MVLVTHLPPPARGILRRRGAVRSGALLLERHVSRVDDDGVAFEKRSRVKKYVKRIITLSKILIGLYQILGQLEVSMDLK